MTQENYFNHSSFNQAISDIMATRLKDIKDIETVIGIPVYNEKETLLQTIRAVCQSLKESLSYGKALLVLAGDPMARESLAMVDDLKPPIPYIAFTLPKEAKGRGASVRSLFEVANHLEADLVILAADMSVRTPKEFGTFLSTLMEPIRHNYDITLARFRRSFWDDLTSTLFTTPLIEVFYGALVSDPHSRVYAVSHDLVEDYCQEFKLWDKVIHDYGIDPWLITRALRWNKLMCEVYLGEKSSFVSKEKQSFLFKQTAHALFECIKKDSRFWLNRSPIYQRLASWGQAHLQEFSPELIPPIDDTSLLASFRSNCAQYQTIIQSILPQRLAEKVLEGLIYPQASFSFDHWAWARVVYHCLLAYCFDKKIAPDDILNSLTFIFDGRMADVLAQAMKNTEQDYTDHYPHTPDRLADPTVLNQFKEVQRNSFFEVKEEFVSLWNQVYEENRPPLVPAHYLEFVPGSPIIIKKKLQVSEDKVVWADEVFRTLQAKYHHSFDAFMDHLGIGHQTKPEHMVRAFEHFMEELESAFNAVFPGDPYTQEGVEEIIQKMFELFPVEPVFTFKNERVKHLLTQNPPTNLLLAMGCRNTEELLAQTDPKLALTLALMTENQAYAENCLNQMLQNCQPEMMTHDALRYIVMSNNSAPYPARLPAIARLERLTQHLVVSPYSKGVGGRYPKIRYVLYVLRQMAAAQNYSSMWEVFARERKNLGQKIFNSLLFRSKGTAFSASSLFEASHHRLMMTMWQNSWKRMELNGVGKREIELMQLMGQAYGLSQVLANGVFLPCSSWTWASYSYKGGQGVPTAAASQVEINWFNRDLFEQIFFTLGYSYQDVVNQINQMIGEGRSSEDLLEVVVGAQAEGVVAVPQDPSLVPEAKPLQRYPGNPILMPVKEHPWESKYVLNAASFRLKDKVYILYRAFGDDEMSRIGLAITDGYRVLERLPYPVFEPSDPTEAKGCEDPRVVLIQDQILMIYTAYDGRTAQVAGARISIEDFLNKRFEGWQRLGLAFRDVWDKDAVVFPEKIGDKYVIYHRIEPSIWVSYMDRLEFPVSKERHLVIMGPRSGRMWDSVKIGAGTQPLKTKYGWLMIYHGVDQNRVYRLGVMLVDLLNPEKLLYRSPNPILEPQEEYELGAPNQCWVPNVVFTCGAVAAEDKEILDAEDEIIVYYGAADTCLCAASAKVGDLIPEEIRKRLRENTC